MKTSFLAAIGILIQAVSVKAYSLNGVVVKSVKGSTDVDLGKNFIDESKERRMLILGTYAADFNAIEYVQRLKFYLPELKSRCGIKEFGLVLNCNEDAAIALLDAADLDINDEQLKVFTDPNGIAGKKFGVGRGWLPDDDSVSPYLKLFGMLWGLCWCLM